MVINNLLEISINALSNNIGENEDCIVHCDSAVHLEKFHPWLIGYK